MSHPSSAILPSHAGYIVLLTFVLGAFPFFSASAGEIIISEVGISLTVPEGWEHDTGDIRAFIIRPSENFKRAKMRIHKVAYKGIPLKEAVIRGLERLNQVASKKDAPDTLISSEPITTKSGLQGLKAVIGPGEHYLNKYYFTHPNGDPFCICVYKNAKQPQFVKECETIIVETLNVVSP